jgi:hypothetical protein
MAQFTFYGTLELNCVCFFVEAADEAEAKAKAAAGQYTQYETLGAEPVNWTLNPKTMELNEV